MSLAASRADSTLTFTWDESTDTNIVAYMVYYGDLDSFHPTHAVLALHNETTLTDLVPDLTYMVFVTSFGTGGIESLPSDVFIVSPQWLDTWSVDFVNAFQNSPGWLLGWSYGFITGMANDLEAGTVGPQEPPVLVLRSLAGSIDLTWNDAARGMRLQQATVLITPDWKDVPGSEFITHATLPVLSSNVFYRLINPDGTSGP